MWVPKFSLLVWGGVVGCGLGIAVGPVWSGTGWHSSVLVSFTLWASGTRVMGNTTSAAALDFLRQHRKGGSTERDGERLLSEPQHVVFLQGFPQAAFQ